MDENIAFCIIICFDLLSLLSRPLFL